MKILHLIANLSPDQGGPPKAALEMCQALVLKGHDVHLFTTNADGGREIIDVPTGQVVDIDGVNVTYFPVSKWRRWSYAPEMGKALRKELIKFDIVHIHSIYYYHTFIAAYLCRLYGIPYIIRPHGTLDPLIRKKNRLIKAIYTTLIEKRNLDYAAAIHYTSMTEMASAHSSLRIKAPGVVASLGIDLSDYCIEKYVGTFRQNIFQFQDRFIFLFLGRLNHIKGLDILSQAFAKVANQYPQALLILAGPDDNGYQEKVRKWLVDFGVINQVYFPGMVVGEEKLALFADSDVFVLPSYTENFGFSVVEAMACKLPVIISNRVNICDDIQMAQAGLVIPAEVDPLAQAMASAINEIQFADLGENGYALVAQKYTWDGVIDKIVEMYQRAIDQHE